MAQTIQQTYSRKRASLGMVSQNLLHYSNPWIAAAWSFFFPGFGHILLGEYVQGWIMFLWELLVNVQAKFNEAIMLAFTGRFHESILLLSAGHVYWILLYSSVFCYSLYESYNLAVEVNNMYELAYEENAPIEIFRINAFQFNFLNKRNPWLAAAWSLLMPGLGGLYTRRVATYVFELAWWIIIVYQSHMLPSIEYTFTGQFAQAVSVLNVEWILFLPSIYGFSFYHSFCFVVEQNRLFDKQQANFLRAFYQSPRFPFRLREDCPVRIVSTFDHNLYLEKALVTIEKLGIQKDQILAVPLTKNKERAVSSLDSIHHSDGKSMMDIPGLSAAFFCALGTIYGFVLTWGPVLWGLIGFLGGLLFGFLLKIGIMKWSAKGAQKRSRTEVVLFIDCNQELANKVEEILWNHQAFGVARVSGDDGILPCIMN
ncbi:MAG: hypothetical protein K6T31_01645 [Alicyclobacillus sp.]|nr:hypothetical protein [Alicyclobacillus sp.]